MIEKEYEEGVEIGVIRGHYSSSSSSSSSSSRTSYHLLFITLLHRKLFRVTFSLIALESLR